MRCISGTKIRHRFDAWHLFSLRCFKIFNVCYKIIFSVVAETLIAALRFRIGVPGEQAVAVKANPLFGNQQFTAPHLVLVKPVDEEYLGNFFACT